MPSAILITAKTSFYPSNYTKLYKLMLAPFYCIQAAKVKDCQVVAEWSEAIRSHFWFVCQECNGDVEKLKVLLFNYKKYISKKTYNYCRHGSRAFKRKVTEEKF